MERVCVDGRPRATDSFLLDNTNSHASFDNLSMWLSEARQNSNNPNLVVMMIGNKTDLADAYVSLVSWWLRGIAGPR